jgi:NAD(P)-dependent dehydrogenase (short-subunit alcohol dehydrogenase family)
MRTMVVGASSGLGRCIGVALAQRGFQVALTARRKDRLDDAAREAGNGAVAIRCDVTDEKSCASAVAAVAEAFGGIDALLYTPAIGPLARIHDVDAETWRSTLDTNVIGASLMTAAALPHLVASHGTAAYLSSVSANQTPPWPGLGAYIVSKVALEKLVDVWRTEHPSVNFTRIVVGDCTGGEGPGMTEFANSWDRDLAAEVGPVWFTRGLLAGAFIDIGDLINVVEGVLRIGGSAGLPTVVVSPRPGTA